MYNLRFQEVIGLLLGPEANDENFGVCYPPLDVYEYSEGLCIEVEIPGVCSDEVDIEVIGRALIITGMKKDMLANKGVRYVRMERGFGKFTRELDIPERFDLDKIEAKYIDGVLKIRVAKVEDMVKKIKRVEIS